MTTKPGDKVRICHSSFPESDGETLGPWVSSRTYIVLEVISPTKIAYDAPGLGRFIARSWVRVST